MPRYEYKVVPAPTKGRKGKGVKGPEGRFAFALETLMNELGAEGWEYVRADTLPSDERSGLTGSTTTFRNVLVFRRESAAADVGFQYRRETPAPAGTAVAEPAAPMTPEPVAPAPVVPAAPAAGETPTAPRATDAAAAAAAAAALTAYREAAPGAPKLGPAPERRPDRD